MGSQKRGLFLQLSFLLVVISGVINNFGYAGFIGNSFHCVYFTGGGQKTEENNKKLPTGIPLDCCGAHEVCEVEEMLKNPEEIIYFEDEELDHYQGIPADQYNDMQIEEFRDVLYTLNGDEIRKWLLSIERRKIQLPSVLKPEALELIAEL